MGFCTDMWAKLYLWIIRHVALQRASRRFSWPRQKLSSGRFQFKKSHELIMNGWAILTIKMC